MRSTLLEYKQNIFTIANNMQDISNVKLNCENNKTVFRLRKALFIQAFAKYYNKIFCYSALKLLNFGKTYRYSYYNLSSGFENGF